MSGLIGWGDMAWGEPLPPRFTSVRRHQYDAVQEIIDAYNDGIPMVVVDAPTGSGKTLIGELVRRVRGDRGLYVCHGKDLQDQFVRDFDAPVLKGRVNYPTVRGGEGVTADQCGGRVCGLCPSKGLSFGKSEALYRAAMAKIEDGAKDEGAKDDTHSSDTTAKACVDCAKFDECPIAKPNEDNVQCDGFAARDGAQ